VTAGVDCACPFVHSVGLRRSKRKVATKTVTEPTDAGIGHDAPCTILGVAKQEIVRQLHARPAFAVRFLTHMLTRNIRIDEDLID
jgi:hypothetical protein